MSTLQYDFRAGNTLSAIRVNVFNKQTKKIVPLSASFTAEIKWSIDGAGTQTRAMNVLTGDDDGSVLYQFTTGELTVGTMLIQVRVIENGTGFDATTVNDICKTIGPSL